MLKAYKIVVKSYDGYSIYLAKNAGEAKTYALASLKDLYRDANYSWFTSCRRVPEWDYLVDKGPGCVAWSHYCECWQIDRIPSHWWYEDDISPKKELQHAN